MATNVTGRFQEAKRDHASLLAAREKQLLVFLAKHTPRFINSDHLTLLGLVSMLGAGASFALARWEPLILLAVIFFLATNWLGDSLDGTLARVRNQQRPRYGFYVDHMSDALGATFLLGGMALSGYMSAAIAGGVLIVYLLLSIQSYLATYCLGTFQISYWRFGPTELRILLAIGCVALLSDPKVPFFGRRIPLFDFGGAITILQMGLMVAISSIRSTVALYNLERLPSNAKQ